MSLSALNTSCPHDEKCLLLQKAFNHYCVTCQMCRMGIPDEYAVHIIGKDGLSEVKRLSELPSSGFGSTVDCATLYSLSDENFYSKEVTSIGFATDV
ncbi:MAG: hypothetical protein HKP55_10310 [Gammaproteobacteria bacterium]|nr:hypothetical protein [Gammaproteobacteria bacterium]